MMPFTWMWWRFAWDARWREGGTIAFDPPSWRRVYAGLYVNLRRP